MELLYVVELEVQGDDNYNRVLRHLAGWLSNSSKTLLAEALDESGQQELAPAHINGRTVSRRGEWQVVSNDQTRALKLVVQQTAETGLNLTTRVTVGTAGERTRFRIGIGRAATHTSLMPVSSTDVYQPDILRRLDQDPALALYSAGQRVEGRYLQIKTLAEAQAVSEVLPLPNRLPTVLVHVRSPESWDVARTLSKKLLGLARTLTLNFATSQAIAAAHSGAAVPFGGLTLVWPALAANPMVIGAAEIRDLGRDEILRSLTRRLGSIAALSHGRDKIWATVKQADSEAHMRELLLQAETARDRSDHRGEIDALKRQVAVLQASNAELVEIGEDAMQSLDSISAQLTARDADLEKALLEAKTWRESYEGVVTNNTGTILVDPWTQIPTLTPRHNPEETFTAITDAAMDHIVFTDRAHKSWQDIDYPEPDDMTVKLVRLAQAAVALYSGTEQNMPKLDAWFKNEHNLTVALTDQTISKWNGKQMRWLNSFEFDGRTGLDATPHVKVKDAVKLNECGRIHFALEQEKYRLVVQHVGIKTYK
ncbi:hypothetical protein [Arthrobacter sp. Edens01]|uniref:hypothetical protein n=1 Tax=Arthrobacter sp. Edens01 TaxID=1732020 RepID=UPI0006DA4C7F|nr:hypothetical protein [Arthrobacter sp. Edens01]KPN16320.1 hypothetical protein AO716_15685 [Arthrobacter sp. Edens01]